MDFASNVPTWDEIERNLETKFGELNQSIQTYWHESNQSWNGFTRRLGHQVDHTYGSLGGNHIDAVREAYYLAEPLFLERIRQHWSTLHIEQIIDVLRNEGVERNAR